MVPSFQLRRRLAPVDERKRSHPRLRLPLAPAPEEEPHGRADAAGQNEARSECTGRNDGKTLAQLGRDVGRLADAGSQVLDRIGELLALDSDIAANVLEFA